MATTTYSWENEKNLQAFFGLRNRPDRFTNRENALSYANGCAKTMMVVYLDENPANFIPGYYVVCPADFSRLEREAEDIFTYVSPFRH